jgi:hypothetical protein
MRNNGNIDKHLSGDELLRFSRHSLPAERMKEIASHLATCELCSDALSGIKEMHDSMAIYHVTHELRKKLRYRKHKKIFSRTEIITLVITLFVLGLILFFALFFFFIIK